MIHRDDLARLTVAKERRLVSTYLVATESHMITILDCPSACDALDIFLSIAAQNRWQFATVRVIKESDPQ